MNQTKSDSSSAVLLDCGLIDSGDIDAVWETITGDLDSGNYLVLAGSEKKCRDFLENCSSTKLYCLFLVTQSVRLTFLKGMAREFLLGQASNFDKITFIDLNVELNIPYSFILDDSRLGNDVDFYPHFDFSAYARPVINKDIKGLSIASSTSADTKIHNALKEIGVLIKSEARFFCIENHEPSPQRMPGRYSFQHLGKETILLKDFARRVHSNRLKRIIFNREAVWKISKFNYEKYSRSQDLESLQRILIWFSAFLLSCARFNMYYSSSASSCVLYIRAVEELSKAVCLGEDGVSLAHDGSFSIDGRRLSGAGSFLKFLKYNLPNNLKNRLSFEEVNKIIGARNSCLLGHGSAIFSRADLEAIDRCVFNFLSTIDSYFRWDFQKHISKLVPIDDETLREEFRNSTFFSVQASI